MQMPSHGHHWGKLLYTSPPSVVVAIITEDVVPANNGKLSLLDIYRQKLNPKLKICMEYFTLGMLPSIDVEAHNISLIKVNYMLINGILFNLEPNKTLQIVPPAADHKLLQDSHNGVFGRHPQDAKIHDQLYSRIILVARHDS